MRYQYQYCTQLYLCANVVYLSIEVITVVWRYLGLDFRYNNVFLLTFVISANMLFSMQILRIIQVNERISILAEIMVKRQYIQ
jgi:hypothetical protein